MKISVDEWNEKHPNGAKVRTAERRLIIPSREFVTVGKAFMAGEIPMVRVAGEEKMICLGEIDSVVSDDASNG